MEQMLTVEGPALILVLPEQQNKWCLFMHLSIMELAENKESLY